MSPWSSLSASIFLVGLECPLPVLTTVSDAPPAPTRPSSFLPRRDFSSACLRLNWAIWSLAFRAAIFSSNALSLSLPSPPSTSLTLSQRASMFTCSGHVVHGSRRLSHSTRRCSPVLTTASDFPFGPTWPSSFPPRRQFSSS
ncbi:unnamed protein product [Ixodes pacificus]